MQKTVIVDDWAVLVGRDRLKDLAKTLRDVASRQNPETGKLLVSVAAEMETMAAQP